MAAKIVPTALPNPRTMLGYDGADFRAILVDLTGKLQVAIGAIALPAGASTLAEQQTQTIYLNLITQLRNALASIATDKLRVSVIDSALPAGAATSAKQDTQTTALQLIDDLQKALDSVSTDSLLVKPGLFGAAWKALSVNAAGEAQVDVLASALPAGAATLVEQQAQTAWLNMIALLRNALADAAANSLLTTSGWDGAAWKKLFTDASGSLLIKAGHDGAAWQVLKCNANRNLINQPRALKAVISRVAPANVAAGATRTDLNINGAGVFLGVSIALDGAAIGCVNSMVNVYIDGEVAPSISVKCNSYANDLAGWAYAAAPTAANPNSTPVGWGGQYDLATFVFTGGFTLPSEFLTSLKMDVVNGDGANITSIKSVIWYQLWV